MRTQITLHNIDGNANIAFDAYSQVGSNCCGNTSWSHTCSGTNRLLIVGVVDAGAGVSVTYGGVSMTDLGTTSGSNGGTLHLFYLINPASGSNTIAFNRNGYALACAVSYNGVKQSSFPNSYSLTSGWSSGSTWANSTTVVGSGCWLVEIQHLTCNNSSVYGKTDKTDRGHTMNMRPATPYMWCMASDSNGTVAAGSQTVNNSCYDGSNSAYSFATALVSIEPYVDPLPSRQQSWGNRLASLRSRNY